MKRSLHIGINDYPGTENDLTGCVNDANDWQKAMESRGYETTMLLDGDASKANMVESIKKLIADTGKNDIAVITYSGHGTWIPDEDSDEADGRDEALCPHDITSGKILTDDELFELFSERKKGARIIILSDSCHSGSVVRAAHFMPGIKDDNRNFQKIRYLAPEFYIGDDKVRLLRAKRVEKIKAASKIRNAAVLISGCKDDEYSYDAWFNERPNGAFTYVALQTLKDLSAGDSYKKWYMAIRKLLPHVRYPQTPQLSGSWEQKNKWKVLEE